jgi:hypothetical protein
MRTPLVVLDVEGVLNPDFSSKQRSRVIYHQGWAQRKAFIDGSMYRLVLNPVHGDWLRALSRETGAELAWGTTWGELANVHVSPVLRLPVLPVLCNSNTRQAQKAALVVSATAGRPFVWLDDSITVLDAASALASEARQAFLPVTVNPATGLREQDIETARLWLEKYKASITEKENTHATSPATARSRP